MQNSVRKKCFDTTEFMKLRQIMEELFPLAHQKMKRQIYGEDCWIFRLDGRNCSCDVMLMSHHDVVKADSTWKYDPFGEIAEDKLWGRGSWRK